MQGQKMTFQYVINTSYSGTVEAESITEAEKLVRSLDDPAKSIQVQVWEKPKADSIPILNTIDV